LRFIAAQRAVSSFRFSVFHHVGCSCGLVGWGEATLEGEAEAVEGALQDLGEKFTE